MSTESEPGEPARNGDTGSAAVGSRRSWAWSLRGQAGVGIGLVVLAYLGDRMATWEHPRVLGGLAAFILYSSLTVWIGCGALVAVPASLAVMLHALLRRPREQHLRRMLAAANALLAAIAVFAALLVGQGERRQAFARAAEHGAPVIEALRRYRHERGRYPDGLDALVPAYIPAIPYTGLIGYPEFDYRPGHNDIAAVPDSYELRIDCPSGGINFDRFIYWPSETYPAWIQGNWTERIGAWAYVHE